MSAVIDVNAQRALSGLLERGEKLIWTGVPKRGLRLRPGDGLLIPFSLLWGGFAIFWETSVIVTHAPIVFPLFGSFFVVVGLYLMIGRFFLDARIRASTLYALTDQRAIILSGIFSRTTESVFLHSLADISISEKSDGSGTIQLGRTPAFDWLATGTRWPGSGAYTVPSFDLIPRVRQVHDEILRARRALLDRGQDRAGVPMGAQE